MVSIIEGKERMLTPIEQFLFGADRAHAVVDFALHASTLKLALAPLGKGSQPTVTAEFRNVRIKSHDVSYCDADDLQLPWGIIGFDCRQMEHGTWNFVLHTDGGEYCFEASWPTVSRVIYVRLLNEGTDVMRPTFGRELRADVYEVLPTLNYDSKDEEWEFTPGSVVRCREEAREGEKLLVAHSRAD